MYLLIPAILFLMGTLVMAGSGTGANITFWGGAAIALVFLYTFWQADRNTKARRRARTSAANPIATK